MPHDGVFFKVISKPLAEQALQNYHLVTLAVLGFSGGRLHSLYSLWFTGMGHWKHTTEHVVRHAMLGHADAMYIIRIM